MAQRNKPPRKSHRKTRQEIRKTENQVYVDILRPRSHAQRRYVESINSHDLIFAVGPAGTGKTHLAVHRAAEMVVKGLISKIYIVRPAVEAGEHLGFLKGDLNQKMDPYFRPVYDIIAKICNRPEFFFKQHVEIAPLAYMRGRTLENCFVILDEAQNVTPKQMLMFLTRLGDNCKAVVNGDLDQCDLPEGQINGLKVAIEKLGGKSQDDHNLVDVIHFDESNVIRSRLSRHIVRRWAG